MLPEFNIRASLNLYGCSLAELPPAPDAEQLCRAQFLQIAGDWYPNRLRRWVAPGKSARGLAPPVDGTGAPGLSTSVGGSGWVAPANLVTAPKCVCCFCRSSLQLPAGSRHTG